MKALIVEENPDKQEELREFLARAGFQAAVV